MASHKTLRWRGLHKEEIRQWQEKIQELRNMANLEHWQYERLEMEITQLIQQPDLREVFLFEKNDVARYRKGRFRDRMKEVFGEIYGYGTLEPSILYWAKKAISTAKRKMR